MKKSKKINKKNKINKTKKKGGAQNPNTKLLNYWDKILNYIKYNVQEKKKKLAITEGEDTDIDNQYEPNQFDLLPCEIMHLIYDHLDGNTLLTIPKVSKKFKKTFRLYDNELIYSKVVSISEKNPQLDDMKYLELLSALVQSESNLPFKLELNSNYLPLELLSLNRGLNIISCLNNIKKLVLQSRVNKREIIDDNLLILIFNCLPELEHLCIVDSYKITDGSIMLLPEKCPKIKSLNLNNCKTITPKGLIHTLQHNVIESLSIKNFRISNEDLESITLSSPNLKNLDIMGCIHLTDISCLKRCHNLESLNFGSCNNINSGFLEVFCYCSKLKELVVCLPDDIVNDIVKSIGENCKNLEYIDINSHDVTTTGLNNLVNCKKLRIIDIRFCFTIGAEEVKILKKKLPNVEIIFNIW